MASSGYVPTLGITKISWGQAILFVLLIGILPGITLRSLVHYEILRYEEKLELEAKRSLSIDLRKYRNNLDFQCYLQRQLSLLKNPDDPIISISALSMISVPITTEHLKKLWVYFKKQVHAKPAFMLGLHSDPEKCSFLFDKTYKPAIASRDLKKWMSSYFNYIYYENKQDKGAIKRKLSLLPDYALTRKLGFLTQPTKNVQLLQHSFSSVALGSFFYAVLPLWDNVRRELVAGILVAFLDKDLDAKSLRRWAATSDLTPPIKRGFAQVVGPAKQGFISTPKGIYLFHTPPIVALRDLRARSKSDFSYKKQLLMYSFFPRKHIIHPFRSYLPLLDLVLFITNVLILVLFRELFSTEQSLVGKKIRNKIFVVFFLGAVTPVSALFILGFSYFYAGNVMSPEEILDVMEEELEFFDRELLDIKSKFSLQHALVHKIIETRYLDKKAQIRKIIEKLLSKKFRGEVPQNSWLFVDNTGSGIVESRTTDPQTPERGAFIFQGPLLEALLSLDSFAHSGLSEQEIEKIRIKSQTALGIFENNVDTEFLSDLFAQPGVHQQNPFSNIFERFTLFLLGKPKMPPKAASMVFFNPISPRRTLYRRNIKNKIRLNRKLGGYHIRFHFFSVMTRHDLKVIHSLEGVEIPYPSQFYELIPIVNAVLRTNNRTRINNLSASKPHLIVTRLFTHGDMIGLAYAVPVKTAFSMETLILICVAIYGILHPALLAWCTSWYLIRPFAPLVSALRATSDGNFSWVINESPTDEFGELALAYNEMARGLREKAALSHFVSENVLEVVATESDDQLYAKGERRIVTVLFSDIRNFTSFSEKYSPETIVMMLNDYFSVMAEIIKDERGNLDKLIGDAMQAVFYDRPGERPYYLRACNAAKKLREALPVLNVERSKEWGFSIEFGIGIATGEVVSGRIGSPRGRLDFTVLGTPVEIAKKLEAMTKLGCKSGILVCRQTAALLKPHFETRFFRKLDDGTEAFELIY